MEFVIEYLKDIGFHSDTGELIDSKLFDCNLHIKYNVEILH